jgi:hypothetical protein
LEVNLEMLVALSNQPLQQPNALGPLDCRLVPRRRGLRPRLLAAVIRSNATCGVRC